MILIVELSGVLFILMLILAMKSVMLSINIFVICGVVVFFLFFWLASGILCRCLVVYIYM